MSVVVEKLVKNFGTQCAVNEVSFEAQDGQILGLLGPNGAGKSTIMKIITSYLPPTSGQVFVNNYSVTTNSDEIKGLTGYLPENNPLYLDQYVHEYLRFIGKLYGLNGQDLKRRTEHMVHVCGLEKEQNKQIGSLSKGFRQRVGLAQTLIHDPDILILDEPTTGLDPNQIVEVRNLIKDLSASKTVILSTHIMQEVQALCNRVVIINDGEIVADSPLNGLRTKFSREAQFCVILSENIEMDKLEKIEGVKSVKISATNKWVLSTDGTKDIRPELMKLISDQKLNLLELSQMEESLDAIFQQLTTSRKDNS